MSLSPSIRTPKEPATNTSVDNSLKEEQEEAPFKSELFSIEQMERHGVKLAGIHSLTNSNVNDNLLARLDQNEEVLVRTRLDLLKAVQTGVRITPAGEWLLDNFYLIEEQIRATRKHLPKDYSRELPRLANAGVTGLPRVYDIALNTIAYGDGRIDMESLHRFVQKYQTVSPLKLGELWAIPIMLRLALIENLRRVASALASGMSSRDLANRWADKMVDIADKDPKSLILVIADMARSNPPMTGPFVSELARRLQWQSPSLAMPLTWVEQRLAETGLTIEQIIQSETQIQASNQVSISNSIGSLRLLGAVDWSAFVEEQSYVEHILENDPAGIYKKMAFATRDKYRHYVEKIAHDTERTEGDLANLAIELAREAHATKNDDSNREAHVGFYLIGKGRRKLLAKASQKALPVYQLRATIKAWGIYLYIGSILAATAMLSLYCWPILKSSAATPPIAYLALAATILVAAQLAQTTVNWLAMIFKTPAQLPRMDFEKGLPQSATTLVVVPTMLSGDAAVESLLEHLEVRFLGNQDPNIYFALLTDFTDAPTQEMPADAALVAMMREGIEDLNERYSGKGGRQGTPFFFFHRPRLFNKSENCWMGFERKRGKLTDLNHLLRGAQPDKFQTIIGSQEILSRVKYVITLDTDTQLPRDCARHLVAVMEHPLNQPRIDAKKRLIVDGYGLLQPRVSNSLSGARKSLFSQLHCRDAGIDPYTRVVSDIYQDLFEEGSFIGKGIYNVDAFEAALHDRLPDNRILSHDLLEGCYVRSGLVSDIEFFEEFPSTYLSDVNRRYRWIRGDWQIADWLLPATPSPQGATANPLTLLSHFKIFDNLRRSLTAPATVALLILSWTALDPWPFAVLALFSLFLPPIIGLGAQLFNKPKELTIEKHTTDAFQTTIYSCSQALLTFACLPFEAAFSLHAIIVTLYRVLISKKNLLEWQASTVNSARAGQPNIGSRMWAGPAISLATLAYLLYSHSDNLAIAAPILLLWLISPGIAAYISKPLPPTKLQLSQEQNLFLNKLARKTWAFFEQLVVEGDNFLPPDNYQIQPVEVIAHRTSPTNFGMALLANSVAYDFGYICLGQLLDRTDKTLKSMAALERYRGHFYNWYDTQTLQPLHPIYISTVDSGNLAGHLLTLRMVLIQLREKPVVGDNLFQGLATTLAVLRDLLPPSLGDNANLSETIAVIEKGVGAGVKSLTSINGHLAAIHKQASILVKTLASAPDAMPDEAHWWANALVEQSASALDDLTYLCPWIANENCAAIIAKYPELDKIMAMDALAAAYKIIQTEEAKNDPPELGKLAAMLDLTRKRAEDRLAHCGELSEKLAGMAEMDFAFLYDETRRLLSIGYNVENQRLDNSYYDLLASEARLANFFAIAQGQLPEESWFALGRLLMGSDNQPVLCSWSGSMFEYLMPLLVMPTFENTLLDQTYKSVVAKQIEYGQLRNVPWGISESGFNSFDAHLNYQYRAFGVPGLGLKRGLADDLVIAPYATVMALMVDPEKACANLATMASQGLIGRLGFYEAIDCTPRRLAARQLYAVVRSWMAHHQGMSLLSLAYHLLDRPLQKAFAQEPSFQATLPLLQERIPKSVVVENNADGLAYLSTAAEAQESPMRILKTANTAAPEIQLLSNGRYNVMITNSGAGYSRWKDLALTRWRPDTTLDNWGTFCYVKEINRESNFWSAAYQPTSQPGLEENKNFEAVFSEARVEFRRRDNDIDSHYEIVVSSEDDIELRRVQLTNRSKARKTLELTSYAEICLTSADTDSAHPAFSNLFIQTEVLEQQRAILCNRRPRSASDQEPWLFHLLIVHGGREEAHSHETDRSKFLGRGNTPANPRAMTAEGPLSNSQGSVLDPIVSARSRFVMEAHSTATIDIVTGVADSREAALALIERYKDKRLADRVFEVSWTHNQVVLRQINASDADAQMYNRLAGAIVYPNAAYRADPAILVKNRRGQSSLWGYSISGDLPIILLQVKEGDNLELVRQMVQAHAYWRLKGLMVDLVIWNEDHGGYRQVLQEQIMGIIAVGVVANVLDKPGGIFVRVAEQISVEDRILFQTIARAIISDKRGSLEDQILNRPVREPRIPLLVPSKSVEGERGDGGLPPQRELILDNGIGGFTPDGREYVMQTQTGSLPPAPWSNVIANPYFGSVISESGAAYTWAENAHEYRISPWHDDPVSDPSGEAFYIRDEETGKFWSPTPYPTQPQAITVSRHGFGYSCFEMTHGGITTEVWMHVAIDAPIKLTMIKVRNNSGRARKLSLTGYTELVLGDLRPKTTMHVVTEVDPKTGALFARNSYNTEFGERLVFFDTDEQNRTISGDRAEFIGRNGSLKNPQAMSRRRLSGKVGAGLDPCAVIQVSFDLADGQEREVVFRLGSGRDADDASNVVQRFRGVATRHESFERLCQYWKHTLGAVNVQTPDQSLNMLANGWLLYQTICCRMWARSGYYQSGGAFGYRDQLQDSMAVLHAEPRLLREQILLCASRQFVEGDVQHWWHPPSGRGVRTHCSDDYLWLPLATSRYVLATGDTGILEEQIHFLTGRPVPLETESYYDLPGRSDEQATLYDHCVRAINHGLNFGKHGLPLIGCGDWNDGMNLVGEKGQGESVWLAFFLYTVLNEYARIAELKGDTGLLAKCKKASEDLHEHVEANAWDGEWYRRAYFDDGTPLGTAQGLECQIDSIAQSWSVLSTAAPDERRKQAMESLYRRLVDKNAHVVKLLDPPFDKSLPEPGYIKGYVPGVRENGGQYTHSAIWATMAFAALGDQEKAWELLNMINPIHHSQDAASAAVYKVEPYVVAADVYGVAPHTGRGGWTWYTGSAGWMYRLIIESLLGLQLHIDVLTFKPCLPDTWDAYTVHYRYRETVYHIDLKKGQPNQKSTLVIVDGTAVDGEGIKLVDDRRDHRVEVSLATRANQG